MKEYSQSSLTVHPEDTVAVALQPLPVGTHLQIQEQTLTLVADIPAKHKFTLQDVNPGDPVYMYGVLVGKAKKAIPKGGLISTENLAHDSAAVHTRNPIKKWQAPDISSWKGKTFMGYHRSDGQVGTANYWLVIPLVFCENRNVRVLQQAFEQALGYAPFENQYLQQVQSLVAAYLEHEGKVPSSSSAHYNGNTSLDRVTAHEKSGHVPSAEHLSTQPKVHPIFPNVDGIRFLTHEGGCGGTRLDSENLCAILAGYIHHPNVAGATVLSLGCQNAQISLLREKIHALNSTFDKPILIYEQQRFPSEHAMLSQAINETFEELVKANEYQRAPAPLSHLTIGMECGGSDGFSGISANPAMGVVADLMVALGGKAILSEFPELCGVEQNIVDRCESDRLADKFLRLMREYNRQAVAVGSGFDMNPSPGNIKDGLITDAIKSAGAAKKGGTGPVSGVLGYGEYATEAGLNLLCTPGNDVESTTGLAGAGSNIILFSTGLGTPTGNPIVPVVKISSNSTLAHRMSDIIDIDAGSIIEGKKSLEEVGAEILSYIIGLASGEYRTKAQQLDQNDFIPWKQGVSL